MPSAAPIDRSSLMAGNWMAAAILVVASGIHDDFTTLTNPGHHSTIRGQSLTVIVVTQWHPAKKSKATSSTGGIYTIALLAEISHQQSFSRGRTFMSVPGHSDIVGCR